MGNEARDEPRGGMLCDEEVRCGIIGTPRLAGVGLVVRIKAAGMCGVMDIGVGSCCGAEDSRLEGKGDEV